LNETDRGSAQYEFEPLEVDGALSAGLLYIVEGDDQRQGGAVAMTNELVVEIDQINDSVLPESIRLEDLLRFAVGATLATPQNVQIITDARQAGEYILPCQGLLRVGNTMLPTEGIELVCLDGHGNSHPIQMIYEDDCPNGDKLSMPYAEGVDHDTVAYLHSDNLLREFIPLDLQDGSEVLERVADFCSGQF
jgi:hypothetical protein